MTTLADEIDNQVQIAQERMERSLGESHKHDRNPNGLQLRIVVAGVMIVALAAGAGLFFYRRRRSLGQRVQGALPDSVRDLPDELRAHLKRPIQRAVRAL
jgi:LPXTG-motif cell wall-anchored protein